MIFDLNGSCITKGMGGMQNSMKLLELIANEMQKDVKLKEEIVVLHINHCMNNSFDFSEVMCHLFHKVVFVGVPYNDKIVPEGYHFEHYYGIQQKGKYVLFGKGQLWEETETDFFQAVEKLIEQALEQDIIPLLEQGKRLLIIEDGGYHYGLLRRMSLKYPVLKDHVAGSVEQTTSGTVRGCKVANQEGYLYPQASVARSDIKMNIESRFIAHRVVEELSTFLYSINAFIDFHNIVLLGYGVIGRRIAQDLYQRPIPLIVYDNCPQIRQVAQSEGMKITQRVDKSCFTRNTVLIGNTGCPAFTKEMLTEFFMAEGENLYLASSSSQDDEFRLYLDMLQKKSALPDGAVLLSQEESEYVSEACFEYQGKEKRVFLIANGFPVNFCRREVISLTNSVIDLIFSEMLLIGKELCTREGLDKKLYLYGDEAMFTDSFTEAALLKRWFSEYCYAQEQDMEVLMDAHPETELLRDMLKEHIKLRR